MNLDSNRSERRMPMAVFFLIGVTVGCHFYLLAFALSPVSGTWLKFVIPALPFRECWPCGCGPGERARKGPPARTACRSGPKFISASSEALLSPGSRRTIALRR
jgi:hypothetical protein